jgi:hypothetical protein
LVYNLFINKFKLSKHVIINLIKCKKRSLIENTCEPLPISCTKLILHNLLSWVVWVMLTKIILHEFKNLGLVEVDWENLLLNNYFIMGYE